MNATATNTDMVFGGIAAYNKGIISDCRSVGDAFVSMTVTCAGASEALTRTVHSVVFGCLVGVNEQSGRIFDSTVNSPLLAKIDNTAKSTATNSLIGWLTKSFNAIRVESIASLTVGAVVGQNSGTITTATVTGLMQIGEWHGVGKPIATAEYLYGKAMAENHYYCGSVAGINNGTASDCSTPHMTQFNVPLETDYNVNSFITYEEKTRCCVYYSDI